MSARAKGEFDVTMQPEQPYDERGGISLARVALVKTFRGDLQATSAAQMIGARTSIASSAGYVAIERVEGTLAGHAGSFVLQHSGTMAGGKFSLSVTVVPDSATGALAGLSGGMAIDIVDGKHFYTFDYELPTA